MKRGTHEWPKGDHQEVSDWIRESERNLWRITQVLQRSVGGKTLATDAAIKMGHYLSRLRSRLDNYYASTDPEFDSHVYYPGHNARPMTHSILKGDDD